MNSPAQLRRKLTKWTSPQPEVVIFLGFSVFGNYNLSKRLSQTKECRKGISFDLSSLDIFWFLQFVIRLSKESYKLWYQLIHPLLFPSIRSLVADNIKQSILYVKVHNCITWYVTNRQFWLNYGNWDAPIVFFFIVCASKLKM